MFAKLKSNCVFIFIFFIRLMDNHLFDIIKNINAFNSRALYNLIESTEEACVFNLQHLSKSNTLFLAS